MARFHRMLSLAIALAFAVTIAVHASVAHADLVDDLLGESKGSVPATLAAKAAADSGGSSATTATTGGGSSGPAIVPAATPLVVDACSTDPQQLQAGSRFTLSLTVKNPGTDDAEEVVVQIGPVNGTSWGTGNELVVLGTGSAQYIGTVSPGQENSNASFTLLANPTAPGGVRTVPVTMTWKSQGYEHTTSEVVGLLVNSQVALDSNIQVLGTQIQKRPFKTTLRMKNTSNKVLKDVMVSFSGSGARPSDATSITVGDIAPSAVASVPMTFSAPLVGRAKLIVTISYTDDFGERRTLSTTSWARVQRTPPRIPAVKPPSLAEQLVAFAEALLGLNG